jgi:hypothetical protein
MTKKARHRKLRCFVASAFGFDDVDRVFLKLIKPTLGPLGITVSRVDRVDHNDDIDNKIMELKPENFEPILQRFNSRIPTGLHHSAQG